MRVLGIMSGTSCDGLDCCDVEIDIDSNYNLQFHINTFNTIPFSELEKSFLLSSRDAENNKISKIETQVTEIFIEKIDKFINTTNFDIISCHGQTVKHISQVISIQLLDYRLLYKRFRKPIVYDFRSRDIFHSGTGAPLMPFLDWLLFSDINQEIITLNIGGISNVSYIPKNNMREKVLGFDTGPGMSLIDKATSKLFNEPSILYG